MCCLTEIKNIWQCLTATAKSYSAQNSAAAEKPQSRPTVQLKVKEENLINSEC